MNDRLPTNVTSQAKPSALPDAWIERLFSRFSAMYGSKFADLWRGTNIDHVKALWAEELGGYAPDEIKRGVDACKTRDWPPTLPEFLKLCRKPIDPERAFAEAVEQMARRESGADRWSHPAIYWAAVKVGAFDLKHETWRTMANRWREVLDEQLAKGDWPEVPERREALPAPGQTTPDPEKAAEYLAKAGAATSKAKDDGLDWARKPSSQGAWNMVLQTATRDDRFKGIVEKAVKDGIATASGKLLKRYLCNDQWADCCAG